MDSMSHISLSLAEILTPKNEGEAEVCGIYMSAKSQGIKL